MWVTLALVSVFFTHALAQCPSGFRPFNGACYYFNPTQLDWFDADEFCTSLVRNSYSSSHLASIETYGEDQYIMSQINADSEFNGRDVWIGGSQIDKPRGFVWIRTNNQFTYTNWYRSSGPTESGKCAYMSEYDSLKWGNTDCDVRKTFVCEYQPNKHVQRETTKKMNCAAGFDRFENSCYYFVASSLNWFDSDQFCTYLLPGTSYAVHLATIESQNEQNFIGTKLQTDPFKDRNYWVGGNNMDKKRSWHWAPTNLNFAYTQWAPNQPDNSGKCLMLYRSQSYRWDDFTCDTTSAGFTSLGFVCEYAL